MIDFVGRREIDFGISNLDGLLLAIYELGDTEPTI